MAYKLVATEAYVCRRLTLVLTDTRSVKLAANLTQFVTTCLDHHVDDSSSVPGLSNYGCPTVRQERELKDIVAVDDSEPDFHLQEPILYEAGTPGSLVHAFTSLTHTINNHCNVIHANLWGTSNVKPEPRGGSGQLTAERQDKITVYVRVVFLKIGEIDTLKENFTADAFVQMKWREPNFDNQMNINLEEIEWDKYWNPKMYIENSLGETNEAIWQRLVFNRRGEATVFERRRIKGCFLENLELGEYPFDTQDLTLTVASERPDTEVSLQEDNIELSGINVQNFVDEQEWKLHNHVETWSRVSAGAYQNSKQTTPGHIRFLSCIQTARILPMEHLSRDGLHM